MFYVRTDAFVEELPVLPFEQNYYFFGIISLKGTSFVNEGDLFFSEG